MARVRHHDNSAVLRLREGSEPALNPGGVADVYRDRLHPERWRNSLHRPQMADAARHRRVAQDAYPLQSRRNLLERLEPFHAHLEVILYKPGDVAARARKAFHEPTVDRVHDLRKHDRDRTRLLAQRGYDRSGVSQDDVGLPGDQIRRVGSRAIRHTGGEANFETRVASLLPPQASAAMPTSADQPPWRWTKA